METKLYWCCGVCGHVEDVDPDTDYEEGDVEQCVYCNAWDAARVTALNSPDDFIGGKP